MYELIIYRGLDGFLYYRIGDQAYPLKLNSDLIFKIPQPFNGIVNETDWDIRPIYTNDVLTFQLYKKPVVSRGGGGRKTVVTNITLTGNGTPSNPLSLPYSSYIALLNQTGTNAPVATVLENTIGNIVWTRTGVGTYFGTLSGAFPVTKTYPVIQMDNDTTNSGGRPTIRQFDINSIFIISRLESTGLDSDDIMYNSPLEIRVYP